MGKRGNGEGSIYYSEKLNRWVGQFTNGFKSDGKINRKTVYGKTRKEVSEKINKALTDIKDNKFVDKSEMTLCELIKECIEDKHNANITGNATYVRNIETLKRIKKCSTLVSLPVQKVKIKDIKDFFNSIVSYSDSSIDKMCRMVNLGFKRAISRKLLSDNPMESDEIIRPKSKKPSKAVVALTLYEQKHLVDKLIENPNKYNNIILLMLYTGMRVGEVLALTLDSIDKKYIHITSTITRDLDNQVVLGSTTKTYTSVRDLPINNIIREIIDDSIKNYVPNKDKLLFYDETNHSLIKGAEINAYLFRLNKKYNIAESLHNHMMRHTFATRCIESGMTAVVLAKKLGHKDVSITLNTYTSVFSKYEDTQDDRLQEYLERENLMQQLMQRG